ncbi:MAG: hypothetical protein ABIO40_11810 [Devosia sp.]
MRRAANIIGILLVLIGGFWVLQGTNLVGGSIMSSDNRWAWTGGVVAIIGVVTLLWFNRRR